MNSTSPSDQSKIKTYSALLSSSFSEMKKLMCNNDLPQILDRERSISLQNTLNAQAEEINNLQQENKILLSQQNDQLEQNHQKDEQSKFLNIFITKANTFLERYNEFIKVIIEKEDEKILQIMNKYKLQIQRINNFLQTVHNNAGMQAKDNQIIQLQRNINELQVQNSTINSLNLQLTQKNSDLQISLQNAENNNSINNNLINQLNKQVAEKNELINSLQHQNQEKDNQIIAFQKNFNTQNLSNTQSSNPDSEYSESFNFTIQDNNSSLPDTNNQKAIDTLNLKIDQLQNSINEKKLMIKDLNQIIDDSKAEKDLLLSQIQQKDNEINKLRINSIDSKSVVLLKQKIEEMTKENQYKDNEISNLQHQIQISSSSLKDDQIQSLSLHVHSLADENSKLKEDIQSIQNSNNLFLEQIKNLQESKSSLNNINLDLNAKIDELETRLNQAQSTISPPSNEIQEMKELLAKNSERDSQKIKSLLQQVKDTLEHSERVKNELKSVQNENAKLQNQIQTIEARMKSIQFTNSQLQNKLKNSDETINQKELIIQQLSNSKDELNQRYEELIETHISLKNQFEQLNKTFSTILGCSPDPQEISRQLTDSIEKLANLQYSVVSNNEIKKEVELLRRQNNDLNNRLIKKEEILQSTLNLCQDGKESEVVKKMKENFTDLNQEHSKLIEEHKQLQRKMFLSESSYKEIESKLIDQKNINEELMKKSEQIELYEFVTSHFIELLSDLSKALITPTYSISELHQKRSLSVDNLLAQLKKRHFSSDEAISYWNSFSTVVQESLVFDPTEEITSFSNQKPKSPLSSSHKPSIPLYHRLNQSESSMTPTQSNLNIDRLSPNIITRTNPLARDSPSTNFEPSININFP